MLTDICHSRGCHHYLVDKARHVAKYPTMCMGFSRQGYWSGLPFLSSGVFPTWGSNLGLPHCMQILYHLSHKGSPGGEVAFPNVTTVLQSVQQRIFPTQGWNPSLLHLLHCRQILYPLSHLGSPLSITETLLLS